MYPGFDGFLNTRASLMLDVVFTAMFAVVPILAWSIYQVRCRRRFTLHKRVQLTLGIVLLATVALFEIDMQFLTRWEERAEPSPYFSTWVYPALYVHLFFAVPTAVLWVFVIVQALRKFEQPPRRNAYSRRHMFWGWLAAVEMLLTGLTGWLFYWLAFVA